MLSVCDGHATWGSSRILPGPPKAFSPLELRLLPAVGGQRLSAEGRPQKEAAVEDSEAASVEQEKVR